MAHTSEHLAVLGILSDNTRAKKGGGGASNLLEQLKRESRHPESVHVPTVCLFWFVSVETPALPFPALTHSSPRRIHP